MCQVVPFTLPCCRKVYVEVSKLPSCPNSWPNRKCPPELCIQVRGYEAEDRDAGICWRCKARNTGASNADREGLRPRIDKATLVLGLDELGVTGRRRREETNGNCWFCGATGGCNTCGARHIEAEDDETRPEVIGKRKRDHGSTKGKEVMKKVKSGKRDQKAPARTFEYPNPNHTSHSKHPYPQLYNQALHAFNQTPQPSSHDSGSNSFQHKNAPQSDLPTYLETGPTQYPLPTNWQSVDAHRNHSAGPLNTYADQQMSDFVDDGGQGTSKSQYYSNQNLSRPELNSHSNVRCKDGPFSANASGTWFDGVDQVNQKDQGEEQVEFNPQYPSDRHLSHLDPALRPALPSNDTPGFPNTYHDEQRRGPYDLDRHQPHLKLQQYDQNIYSSHACPDIPSDGQDVYNHNNYAQEQQHSLGNAGQYQITQALRNVPHHDFDPEKSSEESAAYPYPIPNIQPGLDDLPLQFDVTELDDATLARLLKKYGGCDGENSNAELRANHEAANEYGSSYVGEQNPL